MDVARYASRKFILAAFLLVAAIVLLVCKVIDQDGWLSFSTWVLGLYVTGNVSASYVAKVGVK